MTIRTKLLIGPLFLTLTMVVVGAYAIYGVTRISALMTQTYDGALMASVHAEQAHTNFIKVERALRNALASRRVEDFDAHVAAGENAAADVLSDLDVVAERTWNHESAQLVDEIKALVGEKQKQRAAVLPILRQRVAEGSPLPVAPVGRSAAVAAPRTSHISPVATAPPSSGASQSVADDSGVQIVKRKAADGTVSSVPSPARQVPQVAVSRPVAGPRVLPGTAQATTPGEATTTAKPDDSAVQIVGRRMADPSVTAAAPEPIRAGSAAVGSAPRVPQVGAVARGASPSPATPRVPQVGGTASPRVAGGSAEPAASGVRPAGGGVSAAKHAVPATASAPADELAGATPSASMFEGSERIEAKLRALADRATEAGFVFRESSRKISRTILGVTVGALLTAILIGASVVFLFGRWIANPLRQVIHRLHDLVIGGGTLEHRLAALEELPVKSTDEIGQLRASFNATVALLREREAEVRRELHHEELQGNIVNFQNVAHDIADGDLTRRGAVTNDVLGSVVDSINRAVEKLGSTVSDVQEVSERVSANARDMIVSSEQLAAGAQAQSQEATKAASALEAVAQSVREVADKATASAMAARRALEAAQAGDLAVRQSLEGMQDIRSEVEWNTKKLRSLVDRSTEISEIVTTVQDMAAQTNLLALNAGIEAARAGEAGVRFAVVANEIRKLADRASQAAKGVGDLIQAVQTDTQDAVAGMEKGIHRVEEGYLVSRQASALLQEIATISHESAALAQDISIATQQQVRGTEGVATAVQSIAGLAVQTEHSAVNARETVESLAGLAEELRAKLSQFKVGG